MSVNTITIWPVLIVAFVGFGFAQGPPRSPLPPGTENMALIVVTQSGASSRRSLSRISSGAFWDYDIAIWENLSVSMSLADSGASGQDASFPSLVFVIPESVQEFVSHLNQIGQLLTLEENTLSEVWDPIFFIFWPNATQSRDSAFSTMHDVEFYLRDHISQELRLDSDVFAIFPTWLSESETPVHEIFTAAVDKKLHLKPIHTARIAFEGYLTKSVRRQDFGGAVLKVVGLNDPDFIDQCKIEIVNGSVVFVSGFGVELLFALQYALNFSYFGVEGEGWIEELENGTWAGMARQLRAGEADLAVSLSSHLRSRYRGVGFLHPSTVGQVRIFFRQPSLNSIRDIFLAPFNTEVWALLGLFWILFTAAMIVIYWILSQYSCHQDQLVEDQEQDVQMRGEKFFWCLRVFCQKSSNVCPSFMSTRIVFFCSLFVASIYYVGYSASLVSVLSVVLVPIQSMGDLSQSELVILGDMWLPWNREIVQDVEAGKRGRRPQAVTLRDDERYILIDHAIPKILTAPMAFATFADGFLTAFHRFNYSDRFYCDTFSSINPMKAPISSGMVVQRGSPLKELLNPKILMMGERGITRRLQRHYELRTTAQCASNPKRTKLGQDWQVSANDIFTVYFLIGGGFALSLLLSALEYFVYRFRLKQPL